MIITFSSAIIDSGNFMIDTSNYSDNMALFNFTQNCNIKGKESIAYIFNDNLNYLRSLYNSGKLRPVPMIIFKKPFLVMISTFALNAVKNPSFLTDVILSSVLLVELRKLKNVQLLSLLWLLMLIIVILFLLFLNN